jgi:hypothetical protein
MKKLRSAILDTRSRFAFEPDCPQSLAEKLLGSAEAFGSTEQDPFVRLTSSLSGFALDYSLIWNASDWYNADTHFKSLSSIEYADLVFSYGAASDQSHHDVASDFERLLTRIADRWKATSHGSAIENAISKSRWILGQPVDPESVDSEGYSEAVWNRAIDFLRRSANSLVIRTGRDLVPPEILPGPQGSIDLHWDEPNFEMLINIPRQATAPAGFYADDRGENKLKGTLSTDSADIAFLCWLEGLLK